MVDQEFKERAVESKQGQGIVADSQDHEILAVNEV